MTWIKKLIGPVGLAVFALGITPPLYAAVDAEIVQNLKVAPGVLDTALSGDGKFFFVLSSKGVVDIYPTAGGDKDQIVVEGKVDKIVSSQAGDLLFVTDSQAGATRMVSLDFLKDIDVAGAPFKGPENAPVVVAVFSDFQ